MASVQEAAMTRRDVYAAEPDEIPLRHEAADWDEEDLGLAWDEDDVRDIARQLNTLRDDE
jgi:hypothetical protein